MALKHQVGLRIRDLRRKAGYTQDELAERVGKSTQAISQIERGEIGASVETIDSISKALGSPPSSMFPSNRSGTTEKSARANETKPDPIDIRVGSTVRLLRCSQKISQKRLGEHLGVSFQQIQKYEKGDNRMGAATLYRIALFFGTSIEDLFAHVDSEAVGKTRSSPNGKMTVARAHMTPVPMIELPGGTMDKDLIHLAANYQRIKDARTRAAIKHLVKQLATHV